MLAKMRIDWCNRLGRLCSQNDVILNIAPMGAYGLIFQSYIGNPYKVIEEHTRAMGCLLAAVYGLIDIGSDYYLSVMSDK